MEIDKIDRKILYLLQERNRTKLTHDEIATQIDVSSSTVSNRLSALEENGILVDYTPVIDYEKAGIPHHILFVCTAPLSKRKQLAEKIIEMERIVDVRELLTGRRNLHVEVVCLDTDTIENIAMRLDELGIEIDRSVILRREYNQPFNNFGSDLRDDSEET